MFLIFLYFFSFHLDLLKGIRSNESILPPPDPGLVGGGTHLLTQTHTNIMFYACFLIRQLRFFPSLIIWEINYWAKNTQLALHLVILTQASVCHQFLTSPITRGNLSTKNPISKNRISETQFTHTVHERM